MFPQSGGRYAHLFSVFGYCPPCHGITLLLHHLNQLLIVQGGLRILALNDFLERNHQLPV